MATTLAYILALHKFTLVASCATAIFPNKSPSSCIITIISKLLAMLVKIYRIFFIHKFHYFALPFACAHKMFQSESLVVSIAILTHITQFTLVDTTYSRRCQRPVGDIIIDLAHHFHIYSFSGIIFMKLLNRLCAYLHLYNASSSQHEQRHPRQHSKAQKSYILPSCRCQC